MAELGRSVLKGEGITKVFGYGKTRTTAVDHVDFDFREGEVISIVGESGSGKTTIARMILGLINVTEGNMYFNGQPRDISSGKKRKEYWKNIQAVFQDPFSLLQHVQQDRLCGFSTASTWPAAGTSPKRRRKS